MCALIGSMMFVLCYAAYVCWVYIKSYIFPMERFESKETSIENVKMQQFFHFT